VRADGLSFTQLELRDGLAGLRDDRLLAGDLGEIVTLLSRAASPTPVFTTTLTSPGICMTFA
jgi:hypothetical protein